MVPLSKSAIVAVSILKIIGSWNAFMWPLIVTNDRMLRPLPVGLQAFTTEAGTQYELLMAASGIRGCPYGDHLPILATLYHYGRIEEWLKRLTHFMTVRIEQACTDYRFKI